MIAQRIAVHLHNTGRGCTQIDSCHRADRSVTRKHVCAALSTSRSGRTDENIFQSSPDTVTIDITCGARTAEQVPGCFAIQGRDAGRCRM